MSSMKALFGHTPVRIQLYLHTHVFFESVIALPEYLDPDGGMPFIPLSQDTYNSHSAPVTHCKFSPTAKNIATADTDGVLK